jgi:hypothetical protein
MGFQDRNPLMPPRSTLGQPRSAPGQTPGHNRAPVGEALVKPVSIVDVVDVPAGNAEVRLDARRGQGEGVSNEVRHACRGGRRMGGPGTSRAHPIRSMCEWTLVWHSSASTGCSIRLPGNRAAPSGCAAVRELLVPPGVSLLLTRREALADAQQLVHVPRLLGFPRRALQLVGHPLHKQRAAVVAARVL